MAEAISNRIKIKLDIPTPSIHKENLNIISLPIILLAKTALYLAMRESNISNVALAKKLNCNEKEVRRLLDPYYKSKISFLEKALHILGKKLNVSIIDHSELRLLPTSDMANIVKKNTIESLYNEKSEDIKDIKDAHSEIKDFIKIIYNKSFSNKIKLYKNYGHYSVHVGDEEIKNRVNTLFNTYIDFLDISREEFIKRFKGSYGDSIFELVMAEFIYKNFKLKKRTEGGKNTKSGDLTDLEFQVNGKFYLLECTTRTPNLVQDFINILPKFNDFYSIAKVLFKEYENAKIKFNRGAEQQWYHAPEIWPNILNALDDYSKCFFWKKLRISETLPNKITCEDLNEFKNWLFLNRYMLIYFSKILPEKMIEKFKILNITSTTPVSITTNDRNSFNEALSKFLAQSIVQWHYLKGQCFCNYLI